MYDPTTALPTAEQVRAVEAAARLERSRAVYAFIDRLWAWFAGRPARRDSIQPAG